MSHIPSSAMPHAGPTEATRQGQATEAGQQQQESSGVGSTINAGAGKIADYARENPKTAAAAGVAIVGALAAAAIPLVRGRKSGEESAGGAKSTTRKSSAKKSA